MVKSISLNLHFTPSQSSFMYTISGMYYIFITDNICDDNIHVKYTDMHIVLETDIIRTTSASNTDAGTVREFDQLLSNRTGSRLHNCVKSAANYCHRFKIWFPNSLEFRRCGKPVSTRVKGMAEPQ